MKELRNIDPENFPKEGGFKVPENYFEGLSGEILQKIEKEEDEGIIQFAERTKRTSLVKMLAAACILGLALFFLFDGGEKNVQIAEADLLEEALDFEEDFIIESMIEDNLLAEVITDKTTIEEEVILGDYLSEDDILEEL